MNTNNAKKLQEIEIRLKRAPDDPPERDPVFQNELRVFGSSLRSAGIQYSQWAMTFDSSSAEGYPLAQYAIQYVGPAVLAALATAITGWMQGRSGRKVRLKVGDIEVEARTIEEVKALLEHAKTMQSGQKGEIDET